MKPLLPFLVTTLLVLSGCASRAEREALRQCAFSPVQTSRAAGPGDSLVMTLRLEIRNPGPETVVLDSFQATASAARPLARFSHGRTLRIAPGQADTATLHFALANQDMMAMAFTFLMSPPDSLGLAGTAWIPSFGGLWTSERQFRTRLPFRALSERMNEILRGP